jgi:hypothetical protein
MTACTELRSAEARRGRDREGQKGIAKEAQPL